MTFCISRGVRGVSARDRILRKICSNGLAHRDPAGPDCDGKGPGRRMYNQSMNIKQPIDSPKKKETNRLNISDMKFLIPQKEIHDFLVTIPYLAQECRFPFSCFGSIHCLSDF